MGNLKIKSSGVSKGGLKFRRNLSIEWNSVLLSSENILGSEGKLEKAIIFGDPHAINSSSAIQDVEFSYYATCSANVVSSTGRQHKAVNGPFFKSGYPSLSEEEQKLFSLGSWIPNLPTEGSMFVELDDLTPDVVYEIRCIFADEKCKGSNKMLLLPGEHEFGGGNIVIGRFTAPEKLVKIEIKSLDNRQPYINSIIVRSVDYAARIKSIVRLS